MNILITGGSGLLGQYLNLELSGTHSILSMYNKNIRNCRKHNSVQADIRNTDELLKIFNSFQPDIVVHTAAVSTPLLASGISSADVYDINVNASKKIAEICSSMNIRLIYTSTDLVYAGYRGQALKEDAKLNPVSLYAETKLMGEIKIKEIFDNYLILRVALLYGFGISESYNHFHKMYLDLKDGIRVNLFTDQFRSPIELSDAAEIINNLVNRNVAGETINLGGRERVSRFRLGEILADMAGFDKNLLQPVKMDSVPDLPGVEDVSLNTDKLQLYGIKQKSIEESVRNFLRYCKLHI